MLVCPCDSHWCDLAACRTGVCELVGELPLIECVDCGAVTDRSPGLRLCLDCFVAAQDDMEGE